MKKSKWVWIFAVFSIAWTVFIFSNSLQPAKESQLHSNGFLAELLRFLSLGQYAQSELLQALIRKLAHFTEYAVLGGLLWFTFADARYRLRWPIVFGAAVAACDEGIQLYVPGRSGSPADVALDTCGVLFSVLICTFLAKQLRKHRGGKRYPSSHGIKNRTEKGVFAK